LWIITSLATLQNWIIHDLINKNIEPHNRGKSSRFMECTLIIKDVFKFKLHFENVRKNKNSGKGNGDLSI